MYTAAQRIARFRPSAEDELLLKSLFHATSRTAERSYRIWRRIVDIDDFSPGNHFLLPLLHHRRGISKHDPLANIAKGVYRRNVFTNSMRMRDASTVVALLAEQGIPVLVLKGAALTLCTYQDFGLRGMKDVDIAVPANQLAHALEVLRVNDWEMPALKSKKLGEVVREKHGEEFIKGENQCIDLHWNLFYASRDIKLDAQYWADSLPVYLLGHSVQALAHEEQLLHTVIHGISYLPRFQIRWIADAISIIEAHSIKWERFVELTIARGFELQVLDALLYLLKEYEVDIPQEYIARLAAMVPSPRSYIRYSYYSWTSYPQEYLIDAQSKYPYPLNTLVTRWRRYCIEQWSTEHASQFESSGRTRKVVSFICDSLARESQRLPSRFTDAAR